MTARDPDQTSIELAGRARAAGRPTAWFEELYQLAADGRAEVPWQRDEPHPLLQDWTTAHAASPVGRRAMVVGCGLGDDAEHLARLGWTTTAFDISPTAIATARERHPDTAVDYRPADLLDLPDAWRGAFDLVVESMTVQSMPRELHADGIDGVRSLVARGGRLLVIGVGLPDGFDLETGPPWRLTADELVRYDAPPLRLVDRREVVSGSGNIRYLVELSAER